MPDISQPELDRCAKQELHGQHYGHADGKMAVERFVAEQLHGEYAAERAAVACARFTGGAVAVSGATDLVTDGVQVARLSGGSSLMTCITGSGCSLGGVCAVYACVADPFVAALTATAAYNLAGLRAAETCDGPGSFQVAFLNALYNLTTEEVTEAPLALTSTSAA